MRKVLDFANASLSSAMRKKLVEDMGFTAMTPVQRATFQPLLDGKDVLARARTGSGKTIAFLLPTLERLMASEKKASAPRRRMVLVLSPTRELAMQIRDTAQALVSSMDIKTRPPVHLIVGGGPKFDKEAKRYAKPDSPIHKNCVQVVVATPGRLGEHFGQGVVGEALKSDTDVFVLDEADTMLDQGFRPAIMKLTKALPRARQSLLFSATTPKDMHQVTNLVLDQGHERVDLIGDAPDSQHTTSKVAQHVIQLHSDKHIVSSVLHTIQRFMQQHPDPSFKAVCFFPTAQMTAYHAAVCRSAAAQGDLSLGSKQVFEMHSRKNASQRTKISEAFRAATRGVMLSSDVSARGVDYPNVTHVLQFGAPVSREQYIHRVGRTARAGESGTAAMVLAPYEAKFLHKLKDVPITPLPAHPDLDHVVPDHLHQDEAVKAKAYRSLLGFMRGNTHGISLHDAVLIANGVSEQMGCSPGKPPAIRRAILGKMGLKDLKHLLQVDPQ